MTFHELDCILHSTGRRSLAGSLVFTLADTLDDGADGMDLDDYEQFSGFVRTNIRSVASALERAGVIHIFYYQEPRSGQVRELHTSNCHARWAKQHYRLSQAVRDLLRR